MENEIKPAPIPVRSYKGFVVTAENYREIIKKEGRFGLAFHNKHLKAYLRGDKMFTHGFTYDKDGNKKGKKMHVVLESLTYITPKANNSTTE